MMKKLLPVLFNFSFVLIANTQIVFVNQQVTNGDNNGSSWQNAYPDLQQALAVAQPGDQIWVAAGSYKPTNDDNRAVSFEIPSGVRLYGGFNGAETALEQRNVFENATLLSGEIGNPATRTDNSYHVVYGYDLSAETYVDGFTITGGYADGADNLFDGNGGGMMLFPGSLPDSRPVFRNCVFENNYASYNGGGVWLEWGGANTLNPVFERCTFVNNHAVYGGGLYKAGPSGHEAPFIIESCRFTQNKGGLNGGGIFFNLPGENTILRQSVFEFDSTGGNGGGIHFFMNAVDTFGCKLTTDSCTFRNNFAGEGGCINIFDAHNASAQVPFHLDISECVFDQNKAVHGDAGVLFVFQNENGVMDIRITNCEIANNFTYSQGAVMITGYGGASTCDLKLNNCSFVNNKNVFFPSSSSFALYVGGPEYVAVQISNCLFANNGDGVAVLSRPTGKAITNITNCTFVSNRKTAIIKSWEPTFDGVNTYNKCYVSNSIFWEPQTFIFYLFLNKGYDNIYDYHMDYSLMSIGNIVWVPGFPEAFGPHIKWATYPDFVDTAALDFRLKPCSPAVNAGYKGITDSLGLLTDFFGNPRVMFGLPDAGAYESQDSCMMTDVAYPAQAGSSLSVFPNPSDGLLNFFPPRALAKSLKMEVLNATGACIFECSYPDASAPVFRADLSLLQPGSYIVRVSGGGKQYTAKWLKW